MKNLIGNLKVKELIKEVKNLDIRNSNNHERILILIYIIREMNRTKNKCLYNLCRNIDEAIKFWKIGNKFTSMIKNSCGL